MIKNKIYCKKKQWKKCYNLKQKIFVLTKIFIIAIVIGTLCSACSNEEKDNSNMEQLTADQKENFISALKECSMDPSQVNSLEKLEDWSNGQRYSFKYDNDILYIYFYDDSSIASINLSIGDLHIYDENYMSLNYNNFKITSDEKEEMQIKAQFKLDEYLKNSSSASYNWTSYQRTNEYFAIAGNVTAKNSFGQKVSTPAYVELKKENDKLNIIYVEIESKSVFGTKTLPNIERQPRQNTDASNDNSIILKDGTVGNYGKYDTMDGNQYLRFYVPTGTYKATALVKNSMFYVESIEIHKEGGYDTPTTYNTVNLKNKNDSQIIQVADGQCISLVIGTRIRLDRQ